MTKTGKATLADVVQMLECIKKKESDWAEYWRKEGDDHRVTYCCHCWFEVSRVLDAISEGGEALKDLKNHLKRIS